MEKSKHLQVLEALRNEIAERDRLSVFGHRLKTCAIIADIDFVNDYFLDLKKKMGKELCLDADSDVDYAGWSKRTHWQVEGKRMNVGVPSGIKELYDNNRVEQYADKVLAHFPDKKLPKTNSTSGSDDLYTYDSTQVKGAINSLNDDRVVNSHVLNAAIEDALAHLQSTLAEIDKLLRAEVDDKRSEKFVQQLLRPTVPKESTLHLVRAYNEWKHQLTAQCDADRYAEERDQYVLKFLGSHFLDGVTCHYTRKQCQDIFKEIDSGAYEDMCSAEQYKKYYPRLREFIGFEDGYYMMKPLPLAKYIYQNRHKLSEKDLDDLVALWRVVELIQEDMRAAQADEAGNAAKQECKSKRVTKNTRKTTENVFYYQGTDGTRNQRLQAFCKALVWLGWISDRGGMSAILPLFSGQPHSTVVKWLGSESELKCMIEALIENNLITFNGKQKWVIVRSHFLDGNGKPFGEKAFRDDYKPSGIEDKIRFLVNCLDTASEVLTEDMFMSAMTDVRFSAITAVWSAAKNRN